ncbi:hypothetical protein A3G67_00595 [Candidatus Roizmanbacteria bacterium RIFCSPLOWO2_12_FULL_40_12]|uniref:Anthranilate synthase component I n=1 Tax=Candidatus Roizmanbacteria bacterium RIFCSPLOWO2_01_FULL_40_42 TaxID=1802066 RepID=A0A1F7J698_9BACT|nr:MAG: hypothetical protein A2779_02075 [Candidatus Roizmanbacteria bacterium RIFCSPHIGHO2_01_FULL_40_98]OGK28778.1 MAG: hypothetical protein A3C31_03995 [Candidatus Roizmanbacteria bacterium RIFCSPHIGHO2_02_FULL_40_53]OGK29636.1 MAG: hypothetical protein A2W49_00390 [Candidatus Roizmanbacteria bacterium RIFCSPHIGHO2_12_41_18]OGK36329.1 MAG: hypothetical protein A3E69_02790 [Candidatus Roizmanbacteria bacterium RIFCSPHIGHO2_12_FULL_40_130]OGK51119.1 MAG: hypothetical protein A3B50_04970 [Candi
MSTEHREALSQRLTIRPSLEEVRALVEPNSIIPIYCELPSDMHTVPDAYWRLSDGGRPGSFLLEGAESPETMGRYSYVGAHPIDTIQVPAYSSEDPLSTIESRPSRKVISLPEPHVLPPFLGGWVGFLSYGYARDIEPTVSPHKRDHLRLPKGFFFQIRDFIAFDQHPLRQVITAITHMSVDEMEKITDDYNLAQARLYKMVRQLEQGPSLPHVLPVQKDYTLDERANMTKEEYEEKVGRIKEHILDGDTFQTVLSLRISRQTSAHPFEVYRQLRKHNPSPYMTYINFGGGFHLAGSPPELISKLADGKVFIDPLAGTRPRGKTEEDDQRLAKELTEDPKEKAEHTMLVDLARNDVGRVVEFGSEKVLELMSVAFFAKVMHMKSVIMGTLRADKSYVDVIRATFPAGTVSGAPKVRSMEIIAELEDDERGPYGGGLGYIDLKGNYEFGLGLRTIVFTEKDGKTVAHIQAGAGIVADSDPEKEYEECLQKASGARQAVVAAEKASNAQQEG